MFRLKSSFFIYFTAALLVSLYAREVIGSSPLACAVFLSAGGFGIALSALSSSGAKRAGGMVVAISIGLLFGASLGMRMKNDERASFTGIDGASVTSFRGTCVSDSYPLSAREGIAVLIDLSGVGSEKLGARADAEGRVLVFLDSGDKFYAGEVVELDGRLSPYGKNPGVGFSANASYSGIIRLGFDSPVSRLRRDIVKGLNATIDAIGYPASGFFRALFLGAREDLADDLADAFRTTGTLHVLALSGMHVALVFALVSFVLSPFFGKRFRLVVSAATVALYVFVAGASPSLVRAAIMIGTFAAAKLLDRETDPINILAISAAVIAIADPVSVYSLSFELSYLAMLGIFVMGDPLAKAARGILPQFIALPVAYSIGAQVFTMPLVIQSFGIVYLQGIAVTLILGPVITLFLGGGIVSLPLLAAPLYPLHGLLAFAFDLTYRTVLAITEFFSGFGGVRIGWWWGIPVLFLAVLVPFVVDVKAVQRRLFPRGDRIAAGGI